MLKKLIRFLVKFLCWLLILSVGMVILYKWVPVPVTPLMVIRNIEQAKEGKEVIWKHQWTPIESISKQLQLAVICSEDQNFVSHNGFDLKAIEKAYQDSKKGKRLRGASTISQQTAKNVFLWPERSWFRKALESYFTVLIEFFWSKERIMEVYLNSIEMGNGIYGAEAAAQYWFKKPASNLSTSEAAAIAAVLPNPRTYRAQPPNTFIQNRKIWIMRQMTYYGPLMYELTEDDKQDRTKK